MIYLGIRMVNTLESYWGPDAAEFRPSRWLDHSGDGSTPKFDLNKPTGKDYTFAFQSFLSGSHAYLGRAMAMIEIKMMLGSLIRSLAFSPAYDGQVASPSTGVTMSE
ncbi:hypothetical protein EWM64_g3584 [Hericium alpestre]|uniref:Uncharacterized protein n=1 Tax=Hericium alpestre TaxID=135208 RepID=A0A4Z0A3I7_9AGAM|nr:hypothetical protein EWM64_g3584 [Hericium alpestre]